MQRIVTTDNQADAADVMGITYKARSVNSDEEKQTEFAKAGVFVVGIITLSLKY